MSIADFTAPAPRQTLRAGTRVWLRVDQAAAGHPWLKAGRVIRARGDQIRVNVFGSGAFDFDRCDVRRA